MNRQRFFGVLALTLVVGVVACNRSDDVGSNDDAAGQLTMPQQEMDPETMQRIIEIQTIQQRLQPIQQEALQDEALASQLAGLQVRIEAAMREEDGQAVERMEQLLGEMAEAQTAGDQERIQSVMMEGQALQDEMQVLQARVLERPDLKVDVEAFEVAHRARMVQIDPEADSLLDRMEELVAALPR